ncbi:bifunctional 3-dehydroquinate dehydratase/shikimate dehydrogenase, chloroplastic isoform X1 [Amborella trichopoda]|nr:bifunctional 3-dehydroquinate dehydratase/shikimate dehydrogenase, chloroplastic isoform X1 [Amborella trichopoda]|eukprot:XP_020529786.1 bifunctional 3-dehydroquinate dehydratase/shikimate dehydrogenase, chloroplastic isoform X1 [Amborella trichopoda]
MERDLDVLSGNTTLLCAPLVAQTVDEILLQMNQAKVHGADLVEIRLDTLSNFKPHEDLKVLLQQRTLPAIVTYRPRWQGGQYEGDERHRLDALFMAMELGADYIDVELQVAHDFMSSITGKKPSKFKVIVSSHDYQNTPSVEDLGDLVARIQDTGADIVKIATTATNIADVARIFHVLVNCQVPIIGLVMGEKGAVSRFLSPKFGGYLTYATLEAANESEPGKPTLQNMLGIYYFRQIGRDTKIYGLIGNPVGHSKSPVLYNATFKSLGFNAIFVHLLVDNIREFFDVYSSPDFAGFSVTIPHKEDALRLCDEVDPVAKSIGAVNTIVRRPSDGKLIGYNTDYFGAISAIEHEMRGSFSLKGAAESPLSGRLFIVIGAGGAGKAIAYGAKEKGARIIIANRTYERAKELANLVGGEAITLGDLGSFQPEEETILANSTSLGMYPDIDGTPISKEALRRYAVVFDAVYTPKVTQLLHEAEEVGAVVVSGVEMWVRQAFGQIELFTGSPKAPEEVMRKIIQERI